MARPRYELWGESLRELGVLILVFVPLDLVVEGLHRSYGQQRSEGHWIIVTLAGVIGFILVLVGVEIERR